MYIEDKLFSETSGERYYSVTMTEEEYSLYSEFQKEFAAKQLLSAAWKGKPNVIGAPNKALNRAITKTRTQIENTSTMAIGNPKRQEMIKNAARKRAENLAQIHNTTAAPKDMLTGAQMNNILMR